METTTASLSFAARALKRFGLAGLLFFTAKGLLWLLVPAALAALI